MRKAAVSQQRWLSADAFAAVRLMASALFFPFSQENPMYFLYLCIRQNAGKVLAVRVSYKISTVSLKETSQVLSCR
jgi:hypothetical protein